MRDVTVVVPCVATKSEPASPSLSSPATVDHDPTAWVDRVEAAASASRLIDLYAGPTWTAALALHEHPHVSRMLVMSAGLGLVPVERTAPAYDATFTPGVAASIAPATAGAERLRALRAWWSGLTQSERSTSFTDLAASTDGPILVTASRTYLEAARDDLRAAVDVHPGRFIIVAAGAGAAGFADVQVPVDDLILARTWSSGDDADPRPALPADLAEGLLPGNHGTLGHVAIRHILASVGEDPITLELAREAIDRLRAPLVPHHQTWSRRPFESDDEVRAWIRSRLTPSSTHTGLLRALRSEGRACEQRRFRRLFKELAAERDTNRPTEAPMGATTTKDAA